MEQSACKIINGAKGIQAFANAMTLRIHLDYAKFMLQDDITSL